MTTLAERIAETLAANGVERIFGIPGGGSSLDIIDAADRLGIPFILTRTEAAATIMAAVTGELTGRPGAALVGVGPGTASAVNGMAYASLERSPMVLFVDGPASSRHQHFDQQAVMAPLARGSARITPDTGAAILDDLLARAATPKQGPIVCELTAADAAAPAPGPDAAPSNDDTPTTAGLQETRAAIERARRPVLIVGLEARRHADAVRTFADSLHAPVGSTYKALGVVPASSPLFAGPLTGAVAENAFYEGADLIVAVGFDPVEFIPGTWPENAPPVVALVEHEIENPRVPITAQAVGPLSETLAALSPGEPSQFTDQDIAAKRDHLDRIYAPGPGGFSCAHAIDILGNNMPAETRLACDAGAHMFASLGRWASETPFGVLKSNGLSTMGYALPAAVASRLQAPQTPVLAVTGDGGLAMCLGELATVKDLGLDVTVAVMNDAALSLIDIKQQRQQRPSRGVRYPAMDFAAIADAFGWRAAAASDGAELAAALQQRGPKLVDIRIDPDGYGEDLARLRG